MKNSISRKLFILDTSVLLFDHTCLNKFKTHDIIIPVPVLEELDEFKVGSSTKNFEAREVIRMLDRIYTKAGVNEWRPLGEGLGRVCIGLLDLTKTSYYPKQSAKIIFGDNSNDNLIIDTAQIAQKFNKKAKVILVTKDINLRIKSRSVGINSEDYTNGEVEDLSKIKKESTTIEIDDHNVIEEVYKLGVCDDVSIIGEDTIIENSYYILKSPTGSILVRYKTDEQNKAQLIRVEKQIASNIKPKNSEQTFALDALLDPDIKMVALEGVAGTGKTLLSLASAIQCKKDYKEIIVARPLVSLSNKDIGFLPGSAEDKISPYMQPLYDNLKYIKSTYKPDSRKAITLGKLEEDGELTIMALAFIRGRSISDTYFIIDEAQNLTPHEIKTIVTRAGENTKIVFTGDIHQIDTPYMNEKNNGLTYLIDRFMGQKIFSHVKLEKGERSALANLANDLL
jgi:PhoH-like ATPase